MFWLILAGDLLLLSYSIYGLKILRIFILCLFVNPMNRCFLLIKLHLRSFLLLCREHEPTFMEVVSHPILNRNLNNIWILNINIWNLNFNITFPKVNHLFLSASFQVNKVQEVLGFILFGWDFFCMKCHVREIGYARKTDRFVYFKMIFLA